MVQRMKGRTLGRAGAESTFHRRNQKRMACLQEDCSLQTFLVIKKEESESQKKKKKSTNHVRAEGKFGLQMRRLRDSLAQ